MLTRLEQHITYERVIAPDDLQARYNAAGGAIYSEGAAVNCQRIGPSPMT